MKKNFPGLLVKTGFFKPLDIPLIILAGALCLFIALRAYSGGAGALQLIIRGPENSWIFPLDAELEFAVTGALGETRVLLDSGRAAILSSPCAGQTCISAGGIHRNRQWLACLPNRVFLLIEGGDGGDSFDALAW